MQNDNTALNDTQRLQLAAPASLGLLISADRLIVERLLECGRTAAGLARVVCARLGAYPKQMNRAQSVLMQMDTAGLHEFALQVGAVRHAKAVLGLVDGDQLRAFVTAMGSAPREAALRWYGLVANDPVLPETKPLGQLIEDEGFQCLRAWCQQQPPEIGLRVWVLLPPGGHRTGREMELATQIVNILAGGDE